MTEGKRKCPFTGEWLPAKVTSGTIDTITPSNLTKDKVEQGRDITAAKLDSLRDEWSDMGPTKRSGAEGIRVMKAYRKAAYEYWSLTGKQAPPIYGVTIEGN